VEGNCALEEVQRIAVLHTSAYVSIRQRMTCCCCALEEVQRLAVRMREHTPAYASIRQHTYPSAYVSICQHTLEEVERLSLLPRVASVSIRQHPSASVSIRQHPSA
jgi:hypothetical protein